MQHVARCADNANAASTRQCTVQQCTMCNSVPHCRLPLPVSGHWRLASAASHAACSHCRQECSLTVACCCFRSRQTVQIRAGFWRREPIPAIWLQCWWFVDHCHRWSVDKNNKYLIKEICSVKWRYLSHFHNSVNSYQWLTKIINVVCLHTAQQGHCEDITRPLLFYYLCTFFPIELVINIWR